MSQAAPVLRASRPSFLVLAPLCAGFGITLAWRQGAPFSLTDALLVVFGAVMAHAAVNLMNEYEDFVSGLDLITQRTAFSGGSGALPDNPDKAKTVLVAALGALGIVVAIGCYFLWQRGLPMLMLGVAGVALILTYTRWITRSPILCLLAPGLGFGPVMVFGSLLALGAQIDTTTILISVISFLLASELLLINQLPDVEADRTIGRRHLVITRGAESAGRVIGALLAGVVLTIVIGLITGTLPLSACLALLTAPAALWISRELPRTINQPERLNRVLGANVAMLLATLVLLLIGLSL